MFYTAAWCTNSEEEFRKAIPFELLGESMNRHGSTSPFSIIILEGMELLSTRYIDSLTTYGFSVVDYCTEFLDIIHRFPEIDKAYSRYERNCFLRWIAFHELFLRHLPAHPQFWHLDGDVLLHTSLDQLARDTAGKTFMLQGCPVFLTTTDIRWFELYGSELRKLNADRTAYSETAAGEKEANRKNDGLLANQSLFSNPLRSDQDLLEYLVSAKKILQDEAAVIYDSVYYFIQNPLSIPVWHSVQCKQNADFMVDRQSQILIGNKRVPFMHYQNTFSVYAGAYLLLAGFKVPRPLLKRVLAFQISDAAFRTTFAFKVLAKFYKMLTTGKGRYAVMQKMMETKHQAGLAGILNFLKKQE